MLISAAALAEKVLVFMDPAVTVKENYEFRRIYRKGKSAVSPQLVIYCQRNRRGHSRLGVSVSTKLGCAVVRNRVRRRIREIYRLNKAKMLPGYDLIVVARVRAVETDYQKLDRTYLCLLEQLDLLREDPS
jgi:ribonuclease P protein component